MVKLSVACICCGEFGIPFAVLGLCLASSASQTIGKDLLKVMVSFILLFNAGSVEAARSYLLPDMAVPLGARLTTPDRLSDGGAWRRKEMKMAVRG